MKYINFFAWFFLFLINAPLKASQKPYIPSYDDWYSDDLVQAQANKNYFKEPDNELNYVQYHYIGAHAAERYPRFFPQYRLQEQTILGMLSTGVRGLMISVYLWSFSWASFIREGTSLVCSNPGKETTAFTKDGRKLYQTLHYEMNRIFNFLKSNPEAVITILFDDQCDSSKLVRDLKEIIRKNNYDPILKPSDWPAALQKGEWPTLGWMRSNNKRLVLFTQINRNYTDFTWPSQNYFWKNNDGTINENMVCKEDRVSAATVNKSHRTLVSFGCFGGVAVNAARNYRKCFDYNFVKRLTTDCRKRRFARGKICNVYWADHVIEAAHSLDQDKKKTAFDYVNELNAMMRK